MIDPIGAHRHLVTFETPGPPVPDGEGGFTEGWTALTPDWYVSIRAASVRDLERETAGTVVTTATHIVHGRYRPDVTTETRLRFHSRVFQVNGIVNPEERNEEFLLFCEEQL